MSIQIQTRPLNICTCEFSPAPENSIFKEPITASSRDYGFDFDEEDLAREVLAPVPATCLDRSNPTIGADEFDRLYRWFSS